DSTLRLAVSAVWNTLIRIKRIDREKRGRNCAHLLVEPADVILNGAAKSLNTTGSRPKSVITKFTKNMNPAVGSPKNEGLRAVKHLPAVCRWRSRLHDESLATERSEGKGAFADERPEFMMRSRSKDTLRRTRRNPVRGGLFIDNRAPKDLLFVFRRRGRTRQ